MRIGIDIDGVLFPWTSVANEAVFRKFDIPYPGPHMSWDHLQETITATEWEWLWSAEGSDIVFGQTHRIYAGARTAINALLRDPANHCHFVTHRDPRRTARHTSAFLERHFGAHPWAGLHIVRRNVKKSTLMDWDMFIDDKPETVLDMLAHTRARVFAPARPWNTELVDFLGIHAGRLYRYSDPYEILGILACG